MIWCLVFELYEWFWEHLFLGFIYKSIVLNFKNWGFLFLPRVLDSLLLFLSWDEWFGEHFFLGPFSNFKILGFYFHQKEFLICCLEIFNCDVWFWENLFLICCCHFWVGMSDFGNIVICKNCFQLLDLGIVFFPRFLIFFLIRWWGVGVFELGWMKSRQLNIKKSNPICASVSMIGHPECSHSTTLVCIIFVVFSILKNKRCF